MLTSLLSGLPKINIVVGNYFLGYKRWFHTQERSFYLCRCHLHFVAWRFFRMGAVRDVTEECSGDRKMGLFLLWIERHLWSYSGILCLWFRASQICINNCPTRCNTEQSIYYSASSLYTFRVSTTPIIRSTQNCNYSLRYCVATSLKRGQASLATFEGGSTKIMTRIIKKIFSLLKAQITELNW